MFNVNTVAVSLRDVVDMVIVTGKTIQPLAVGCRKLDKKTRPLDSFSFCADSFGTEIYLCRVYLRLQLVNSLMIPTLLNRVVS